MIRRVALVSPYALSVPGGVQEQVLAMSRELSARGHDVLVVAPDGVDERAYDTPARVARFGRRLSLPANGSRAPITLSPRAARAARDAVAAFNPGVVHFHEPFAPLLGWAVLASHRAPAVATLHRSGDGPAVRWTGPLLARLARGVDVTVAVSAQAAATMGAASGLDPIVLFNGLETERFAAAPREREGEPLVVVLGRLEQRKGQAVAVEAVRAHNELATTPWRLAIVGDGPERARLEALSAHDERVIFAGAVGDAERRAWLRRAHVVVAPSLRGESFGLVLLEAMASESSVVASDLPGYRAAAAGHARLVAPGDAGALAAAITATLAEETPASIAAARAHAEEWSMHRLVNEYETIYIDAAERFGPTR